ncbi:MAG: energy-coupling factor transporter transmembrane protein EcfT [Simkaniaceae bacterium]|nr:energy-coupling factor transporter transmembrane protein EcfT [Simkaniaceae bacterium]
MKIIALLVLGTILFVFPMLSVVSIFPVFFLFLRIPFVSVKPAIPMVISVVVLQLIFSEWIVSVRFLTLIMAASYFTHVTRSSEMVASIEYGLKPLGRWWRVEKVSLAIALTFRFIPLLKMLSDQVREAQRSRGLERSAVAYAIPLIVRTLKMSTEIAEAIDARTS